jgi:mannose-6-phosphate isomerase-like protein (cupin superfamily)
VGQNEVTVSDDPRSYVIHLAEALTRLPGPAGEHAIGLLRRGTLDVALSVPVTPKTQTPHAQDEIYVVVRGRGVLLHDGKRDAFEAGDLLFVAAGVEHQFCEHSEDLTVWRLFYGAQGGERRGSHA